MTKKNHVQIIKLPHAALTISRRIVLSRLARYANGRQVTVRLEPRSGGSFLVHRIMQSTTSKRPVRPLMQQRVEAAGRCLAITSVSTRTKPAVRIALPSRGRQHGPQS